MKRAAPVLPQKTPSPLPRGLAAILVVLKSGPPARPLRVPSPLPRGLAVILVVLVAITFGRSVTYEFLTWDDDVNVSLNPHFQPPTIEHIAAFWREPYERLYIPVPYTLWGLIAMTARVRIPDAEGSFLNPWTFHAANVAMQGATAVLVFTLLRRLFRDDIWAAFLGAALFALHPIQVEAVAWVTGMRDLLAGFFTVLALLYYVKGSEGERPVVHWALAVVAFGAAMLSKPASAVTPILAGAIDLWLLGRPLKMVLRRVGVGLALTLPVLIVTHLAQPTEVQTPGPWYAKWVVAGDSLAFYVHHFVWPIHFSAEYGRRPEIVLARHWAALAWSVPIGLLLAAWAARRRWPFVLVAAVIFFVALLPTSGLVPFGFQVYSTVADRYAYVAVLGPALLLAGWLRGRGRLVKGLMAAMVVALAVRSLLQVGYWRDNYTVWRHVLDVDPNNGTGNTEMGSHFVVMAIAAEAHGQRAQCAQLITQAEAHYRRAVQTNPAQPIPWSELAQLELREGNWPAALADARELLHLSRILPLRGDVRWMDTFEKFTKEAEKRGDAADAALFREERARIIAGTAGSSAPE